MKTLTYSEVILLDKAAGDCGFPDSGMQIESWRTYHSPRTRLQIWLTVNERDELLAAFSRRDVYEELDGLGEPWDDDLPTGAAGARLATNREALSVLLKRAFDLSRSLPDEPYEKFLRETRDLTLDDTEVRALTNQRIGQKHFREGLLNYWGSRCALTGLDVPELLVASHIRPWAACSDGPERLEVFNGLLLAAHVDALFDKGFITFDDDGRVVVSSALSDDARALLHIDDHPKLIRFTKGHRHYMAFHRAHVFRG